MKGNKIKIATIILIIILIAMIAFFGVYIQKQNEMENQVKQYSYAMDIHGARNIMLKPSEENKTIVKDSSGKIIEDTKEVTEEQMKEKGYTKEEKKYNEEGILNKENYEISKKLIEERLKALEIGNYIIRLNEENGEMAIEIDENINTDSIVSNIATVGKFEIVDSETNEVLMNNNDIKEVKVMYGSDSKTTQKTGTSVYLDIEFNKEGAKKLEEITGKYTKTLDAGENATTENKTEGDKTNEKKITMKIDDETIMSTSFEEVIKIGKLQLTYGKPATDNTTVQENAKKANNMAVVMNYGNIPVKYEVKENKFVLSDITEENLQKIEIGIAIIAGLAFIIAIFRYKTNGVLGAVSFIGLAAVYLLLIRYANVILSLEGIFAIIIILVLNYIFIDKLLNNIEKNNKELNNKSNIKELIKETYTNFFIRIIPICIMSIVFCFIKWIPISSFGMVMFWGILLIFIYNYIVTTTMLKLKKTETNKGGIKSEE